MNAADSDWAERARENLCMCELAYVNSIWTQTCFHAQQCVELILKGVLVAQSRPLPRTHTIADLLNQADAATLTALHSLINDMRDLDLYYAPTRYPDAVAGALPSGLPQETEAGRALSTATDVMAVLD